MFKKFKDAVALQFLKMQPHQLFRTDVEKELMWMTYLESFPARSNPMRKERTEHDCQACKSFIRAVGTMVAIIDGELVSLWDCEVEEPYATVAKALSELVKEAPIKNVFLHDSTKVGIDKNYQETDDGVLTWHHFHLVLPKKYVSRDRGTTYGEKRTTMDLFKRSLNEITTDSIETVIELIEQSSLYRGAEHLNTVKSFLKEKKLYDSITDEQAKDIFVWKQNLSFAVTRIRNTSIGTLLVDLSNDVDLDQAVRMFESKVAPQNYKRPKALITKAMIAEAKKTVEKLGYSPALDRRFAVPEDITVNNVLFANRDARKAMNADVFDEMASEVRDNPKALEKVEEIPIEKFVKDILPKVSSIELLLENRHSGNLVNLVAPVDPEAKHLFKWSNNFSWTYNGDLADSIRERVKARGGSVTGDFRASLAWFNGDDLDLHLIEPDRNEIYYNNPKSFKTEGELDVDMNARESGGNFSRNAVENITFPRRSRMLEGQYKLFVDQYNRREDADVGFEVELEFDGHLTTFAYDRGLRSKEDVVVATFSYSHREGIKIIESLPKQDVSKTVWNLPTQKFHPVQMMMLSPNHWDEKPVGNKHWFFMLQDCLREGSSRGFFNEQLSDDLHKHRKVFEIIGSKMRTEEKGSQLSGLGFSSTKRNNVYAKVSGTFTRTLNITF